MKFTKKALSIALAFVMIFSALAISSVSASAAEDMYDGNFVLSYDQYIRDYAYGTWQTATWPRQATFNKDGWMRIQSQTKEEYAKNEPGHFEKQWQYRAYATPEYDAQFHNGIKNALENDGAYSVYMYVKNAKQSNATGGLTDATVELMYNVYVIFDRNQNGVFDEAPENLGGNIRATINDKYGFKFCTINIPTGTFEEYIDAGVNYKLDSILINIQNYDGNLGMLDAYISPAFTEYLPGFQGDNTASINSLLLFDAENRLDPYSFEDETVNKFDVNEWQWTKFEMDAEEDKAPIYGEQYGFDDIVRDANNYPTKKDGTIYIPQPRGRITEVPKIQITELKGTASGTTATLTWKSSGNALKYQINETTTGKNYYSTTTSYKVTGLTPGKTYNFRVRGLNTANAWGGYCTAVSVKVPAAKPAAPSIKSASLYNKNQVKITWGKVANAKQYEVWRKIGSGKNTKIKTTTSTSYTDPKAKTAGTYSYTVYAVGSLKSNASKAKTVKVMSLSAKPTVKGTGAKKAVTIKVSKKVTNASGYQYQTCLKKTMKGAKSSNSSKIKSLKAKKVYYVRARAYQNSTKGKVYGAWSKVVKVKTK